MEAVDPNLHACDDVIEVSIAIAGAGGGGPGPDRGGLHGSVCMVVGDASDGRVERGRI